MARIYDWRVANEQQQTVSTASPASLCDRSIKQRLFSLFYLSVTVKPFILAALNFGDFVCCQNFFHHYHALVIVTEFSRARYFREFVGLAKFAK